MFEKYSYKQKCLALAVLFVLLSVTAYKRSFSTLFEVMAEYRSLSAKAEDVGRKSQNTGRLTREIEWFDKVIGKEDVSKEQVQQGIVGFASQKQAGVSINDLQPIHLFSDENYNIITNQLDLTGKTGQLLALSYDFEKEFLLSRPVSMKYYMAKKNNKSEVLHLKIIFQNYENTK